MKKIYLVIVVLALAFVFVSCSSNNDQIEAGATTNTIQNAFRKWNSLQVVSAFRAAGLECENATNGSDAELGVEMSQFVIPSIGEKGGRVVNLETQQSLDSLINFLEHPDPPVAAPWVFVKDNILVEISRDLPDEKANKYQDVLNHLDSQ